MTINQIRQAVNRLTVEEEAELRALVAEKVFGHGASNQVRIDELYEIGLRRAAQ